MNHFFIWLCHICLFLLLVFPVPSEPIVFDPATCHNVPGQGNVVDRIAEALRQAVSIADDMEVLFGALIAQQQGANMLTDNLFTLSEQEQKRAKDHSTAYLVPTHDVAYLTVLRNLHRVAKEIAATDLTSNNPLRVYCDTPEGPNTFVKKTTNENNQPILDSSGHGSFQWVAMMFERPVPIEIGQPLCQDSNGQVRAFAQTRAEGARLLILCPVTFHTIDYPFNNRGQSFWSQQPPLNDIDTYCDTLTGALLHELHHLRMNPTMDWEFNPPWKTSNGFFSTKAVQWGGVTSLASLAIQVGVYDVLWYNADTFKMFSISMHLYGADWPIGTAMPVGFNWAELSPDAIPNAHKMLKRENSSSEIPAGGTQKKSPDLQDSPDLEKRILTPATPGVKSLD